MKDPSFRVGRFKVVPQSVRGVSITRFAVYLCGKLIGSQMSYPTSGNCEAMLLPKPTPSEYVLPRWSITKSPGRPRKDAPKRIVYDDLD